MDNYRYSLILTLLLGLSTVAGAQDTTFEGDVSTTGDVSATTFTLGGSTIGSWTGITPSVIDAQSINSVEYKQNNNVINFGSPPYGPYAGSAQSASQKRCTSRVCPSGSVAKKWKMR